MVRLRLALTLLGVLAAGVAEAQPPLYVGMLTPHIGAASGGDVRDKAVTPGISLAVLDGSGLGVEVDAGHSRKVDDSLFSESAITSVMVNALGMWTGSLVRPLVVAGVGLLRVRTALAGTEPTSRTDWGFNAGAGATYMFNEEFGVRGDVRYFRYFQRHADLPLRDNGFFDYWRTSVGVTLSWPIR